jgi:hypothetical protein
VPLKHRPRSSGVLEAHQAHQTHHLPLEGRNPLVGCSECSVRPIRPPPAAWIIPAASDPARPRPTQTIQPRSVPIMPVVAIVTILTPPTPYSCYNRCRPTSYRVASGAFVNLRHCIGHDCATIGATVGNAPLCRADGLPGRRPARGRRPADRADCVDYAGMIGRS